MSYFYYAHGNYAHANNKWTIYAYYGKSENLGNKIKDLLRI